MGMVHRALSHHQRAMQLSMVSFLESVSAIGPLPRGPVGIREPAGIHADPQVYAAHIPVIHIVPQVNPASFTAFAP
jgi:hypothetical protein